VDTAATRPRRGVKPRKERSSAAWQHGAPFRTTSRIKAPKVTASVSWSSAGNGGCTRCPRKNAKGASGAGDRVTALGWWCPSRGGRAGGERSGSWETDFTIRNPANPRVGCRVQQTCEPSCRGNRRGGEKPRGWNRTSRLVASRPKVAPATGSGCTAEMSAEGRQAGCGQVTVRSREPHERRLVYQPGRQEGSEGEPRPGGSTCALPRGTLAGDFGC